MTELVDTKEPVTDDVKSDWVTWLVMFNININVKNYTK